MNNPGLTKFFYKLMFCLLLVTTSASADNKYTNNFYTSATFLYWCTYKKLPTSEKDITSLVNLDSARKKLTISVDDWLSALAYEIKDGKLTIINKSKTVTGGQFHSSLTSTSSTNCSRINKNRKQQ